MVNEIVNVKSGDKDKELNTAETAFDICCLSVKTENRKIALYSFVFLFKFLFWNIVYMKYKIYSLGSTSSGIVC